MKQPATNTTCRLQWKDSDAFRDQDTSISLGTSSKFIPKILFKRFDFQRRRKLWLSLQYRSKKCFLLQKKDGRVSVLFIQLIDSLVRNNIVKWGK